MKSLSFILLLNALSVVLVAQNCTSERYLSNIFQSSVTQDVVFGNSPALTAVYIAENVTVDQDMTMDVFFPVGDDLPKRPLVILAYGGGYLFGTKEDEDVWVTCDSLAKKGYVTASINYRMNMNVASPASAVRAIYRAAQDYSSAIRYLKEYSDVYGIDTNYVFVGGVSAGGFSAMHAVFLDENERPAETFQSGIAGINPDLGCLSCAGNNYSHTNNVRGIINLWGALMDTSYIQQEELLPMTLFHGTNDLIVPYDYGFPFTALFLMPEVHGSANIANRVINLGGSAELNTFPGVGHNIWGLNVNNVMVGGPTEHWSPITDSIVSFLYENIRPEAPLVYGDGGCTDYPLQLIADEAPDGGYVCWEIEGAQIMSSSPDSSVIDVLWTTAGNYEVSATVVNHLGAYSETVSITVDVSTLPTVTVIDNNGTLEATGNHSSYQWYLDGEPITGATQNVYQPTQPGVYQVAVTNANMCSAISEGILLVGLNELVSEAQKIGRVEVYDLVGRFIWTGTMEDLKMGSQSGKPTVVVLKYFDTSGKFLRSELSQFSSAF